MNRQYIIIRINGSNLIGLGHLYRTLAISSYLRKYFYVDSTYIINKNNTVESILTENSFHFYSITKKQSLNKIVRRLNHEIFNTYLCLIDIKGNISGEAELFKLNGYKLILIENLSKYRLIADINIYPSIYFSFNKLGWNNYKGQIFGGSKFVPLNEKFTQFKPRKNSLKNRDTILVTMGGSDPNNLSLLVMQSLAELAEKVRIVVVLGKSFRNKNRVSNFNKSLGGLYELKFSVENMQRLMSKAGLAITAVGTTIYELTYMGVPIVVISNYTYDKEDEKRLSKFNHIRVLGFYKNLENRSLINIITKIWFDDKNRAKIAGKAMRIIDNKGAERICRIILKNIK